MTVHLIKSSEVAPELFTHVVNLLQAVNGPLRFKYDADSVIDFERDELSVKITANRKAFEKMEITDNYMEYYQDKPVFPMERRTATWETLFKKCSAYRIRKEIIPNEFVLLLTDIPNSQNWFATLDEKMPFNGFIHTADWENYINSAAAFPIAYEVIALVLQKHMFNGMASLRTAVHTSPVGCVNDMCMQKTQVILKLRTADICLDCMEKLKDKVPREVIHHVLSLMESLRLKMRYAQNYMQNSPPGKMVIESNSRIFLPEFSNIEIKLRPLEKALYILFLRYPAGIYLTSLCDYRLELYDLYAAISLSGTTTEMRTRIDDMTNVLNNSASEKLSRIKRVFEETIGPELAKQYYIRGEAGEVKRIRLDRKLLTF